MLGVGIVAVVGLGLASGLDRTWIELTFTGGIRLDGSLIERRAVGCGHLPEPGRSGAHRGIARRPAGSLRSRVDGRCQRAERSIGTPRRKRDVYAGQLCLPGEEARPDHRASGRGHRAPSQRTAHTRRRLRDRGACDRGLEAGGPEIGSASCYQDGISSVIEWSYEDQDLLVRAAFPYGDAKSVASWWLDVRDLIGPGVGEAPFPNTAEAALMSRIPTDLRQDCHRGSYGPIATSMSVRPIASIECPQDPGSGATSLEVRQISAFDAPTPSKVVEAITGSLGGCPPPARADGRWFIGARDVGAIVCYSDQHPSPVIDWSYDSDQIIARVRRSDERRDVLYEWWLANAPKFGFSP